MSNDNNSPVIRTILVVDDLPENIQILNKILRDQYQVYFATNGKDALESVANNQPDLILLDIVMPEMDGLDVCTILQADRKCRDIPIIFVTGKEDPEAETQGFAVGAVDFITKPVNPSVVRARVKTHLEIKKQRDELEKSNARLLQEIQERELLEHRLREQAEFDELTKLPNRKLFQDRLQQAILQSNRTAQTFALMFIDLDRFKWVNDTLGHDAGDELLIMAAERLSHVVRQSDTIARLGGDEFTVILPNIMHLSMADLVARKILEQMSLPFKLKQQEVGISSSVGVAIYPNDGTTAEDLIKNADSAMYQAKESGRNAFQFFSSDINQKVRRRLQMEGEMRHALHHSRFFLDYQPKIDLNTNKIIGMEALVRWDHPEEGILFPKDFIPLAEETGLIIQIGAWVLRTACQDAAHWIASGYTELKLAVNLSTLQFRDKEQLVVLVEDTLTETGFPAHSLELEITESMMMDNLEQASAILTQLRALGVTIFMDDFGTGYSSLAMLKHLPIQALKIDRSFINNLEQHPNNSAFISAIISMAKQLGLHVVTEGVENRQQLQTLRKLGGKEVQGFIFSPPLGQKAFQKLLQGDIPLGGIDAPEAGKQAIHHFSGLPTQKR
ncbi:MAG: EAL domain-containing protein [Magnetococcales bacterium]|nr:EAL domain-containing protein [Magnetococcales bacterium]